MKTAEQTIDAIEEIRQYCNEHIRPFANEFDETEHLPESLIRDMAKRGYWRQVSHPPIKDWGLIQLHMDSSRNKWGKLAVTYGHY